MNMPVMLIMVVYIASIVSSNDTKYQRKLLEDALQERSIMQRKTPENKKYMTQPSVPSQLRNSRSSRDVSGSSDTSALSGTPPTPKIMAATVTCAASLTHSGNTYKPRIVPPFVQTETDIHICKCVNTVDFDHGELHGIWVNKNGKEILEEGFRTGYNKKYVQHCIEEERLKNRVNFRTKNGWIQFALIESPDIFMTVWYKASELYRYLPKNALDQCGYSIEKQAEFNSACLVDFGIIEAFQKSLMRKSVDKVIK